MSPNINELNIEKNVFGCIFLDTHTVQTRPKRVDGVMIVLW